jgi:hypothetical protein
VVKKKKKKKKKKIFLSSLILKIKNLIFKISKWSNKKQIIVKREKWEFL